MSHGQGKPQNGQGNVREFCEGWTPCLIFGKIDGPDLYIIWFDFGQFSLWLWIWIFKEGIATKWKADISINHGFFKVKYLNGCISGMEGQLMLNKEGLNQLVAEPTIETVRAGGCTASEIGHSPHLVAVTWKYKKPCYFTIWWHLMCAYVTDRLFIVV